MLIYRSLHIKTPILSGSPGHITIFNKRVREKKEALEAFEAKMINLHGYFSIDRLKIYTDVEEVWDSRLSVLPAQTGDLPLKKPVRTPLNGCAPIRSVIWPAY